MNILNTFKKKLKNLLEQSNIRNKNGEQLDLTRVNFETPRDCAHGDLACNAAMVLAKDVGENPRQLAERIKQLFADDNDIADINIAGPGFINLRFTDRFWRSILGDMLDQGLDYGRSTLGAQRKVNVEFVSANPTGPMHVGHCRGAIVGDVLANLLKFTGHDVTKEYYINDAGGQIDVLAQSVLFRYRQALGQDENTTPKNLYPGEYLIPVGQKLAQEFGSKLLEMDDNAITIAKQYAVDAMMQMIKSDLACLNIYHDIFFSEHTLHEDKEKAIRTTINDLTLNGYVYRGKLAPPKGQRPDDWEDREQVLFRSTEVGDDQDRPLVKSDGSYTYFAADVAYFKDKFDRGFKEMIYVLGADHAGYVKRLEAVAKAVSGNKAKLTALLCQLVKLYRDGEPVKMSKRAGNFVTLRDIVDEVGRDSVRFMMLYRKADMALDFDFTKVIEQSKDNPIFYVQYASARCHSIFRQAQETFSSDVFSQNDFTTHLDKLTDNSEMAIIKKLAEYPRLIELAAIHQEPHRLAFFLYDLASCFHAQWNKGNDNPNLRFIKLNDRKLSLARLGLVQAVCNVLTSGLRIIGADAPTQMQ